MEIGEIFLELFFSCVRQEKNRELDRFDRENLGKGLEDWRPVANPIIFRILLLLFSSRLNSFP